MTGRREAEDSGLLDAALEETQVDEASRGTHQSDAAHQACVQGSSMPRSREQATGRSPWCTDTAISCLVDYVMHPASLPRITNRVERARHFSNQVATPKPAHSAPTSELTTAAPGKLLCCGISSIWRVENSRVPLVVSIRASSCGLDQCSEVEVSVAPLPSAVPATSRAPHRGGPATAPDQRRRRCPRSPPRHP